MLRHDSPDGGGINMCRFLLVRSKNKIKPEKLLNQFASMCEKSHDPGGDRQGDGWGIAVGREVYKSLKPIWKEKEKFKEFGETNTFVVHARSAGFPHHRGNIEYNQPYISNGLCFVFNGMIKGVKLRRILEGKIGAQKIFSLIQIEEKDKTIDATLRIVDKLLLENSKKVTGMNIGVVKNNKFYLLCEYENNPSYFGIRYYHRDNLTLVCSEPIGDYNWEIMQKSQILVL